MHKYQIVGARPTVGGGAEKGTKGGGVSRQVFK